MRLIDANTLKAEFTGNFQNEYTKAEIHALIDLAPTVATDTNVLGKWISVKDRMPILPHDNIQRGIIVCDENKNVHLTRGLIQIEIDGEILYFDDSHINCYLTIVSGKRPKINILIKGNEVTYWIPLTEPPKEVKQE